MVLWFETRGGAALLTMRVEDLTLKIEDLIQRRREAPSRRMPLNAPDSFRLDQL
jgi:hypothetical protein